MRQRHDLIQGSDEWHAFRATHYGASMAAAMFGLSPHTKRDELIRMKAIGTAKEFSEFVQTRILDNGHRVEAMARPIAEEVIGDDLYPVTMSDGLLSASCDGLTMDDKTAFEHKQWNAALAGSVANRLVPDEHMPQCQQVMMVTGAERLLFMVSDGTRDNCVWIWVKPDPDWFRKISRGWEQFGDDVAAYQHVEDIIAPTGTAPETLPALRIELSGMVTFSNLSEFRSTAMAVIDAVNTDLQTDEDFADAEKAVKWAGDVEKRIEAAKGHALSQTASIDELFRTLDEVKEYARCKRLNLEKLVKARKESVRAEIVHGGRRVLAEHVAKLESRIHPLRMPLYDADFAGAVKGKKNIASMRDAVNTLLAQAKIDTSDLADGIEANQKALKELASGYLHLFADLQQIVTKPADDFAAIVKMRVAEHQAAEQKRLDDQREKIRAEEESKATAKMEAELDAVRREEQAKARDDQLSEVKKAAINGPDGEPQAAASAGTKPQEPIQTFTVRMTGEVQARGAFYAHKHVSDAMAVAGIFGGEIVVEESRRAA